MCRALCNRRKLNRMDGEPPPFVETSSNEENRYAYVLDEDDDVIDIPLPAQLPSPQPLSRLPPSSNGFRPGHDFSEPFSQTERARDTVSITEYASTISEPTTQLKEEVLRSPTAQVKRAVEIKADRKTDQQIDPLSAITEEPTLESLLREKTDTSLVTSNCNTLPLGADADTEFVDCSVQEAVQYASEEDICTLEEKSGERLGAGVDDLQGVVRSQSPETDGVMVPESNGEQIVPVSQDSSEAEAESDDVHLVSIAPSQSQDPVKLNEQELQNESLECSDISLKTAEEEDSDSFLDFDDFASAPPPTSNGGSQFAAFESATTTTNNGVVEDDWAAFQGGSAAPTQQTSDDDWGAFDEASPAPVKQTQSSQSAARASINDDDWEEADFASAPPPVTSLPAETHILPVLEEITANDSFFEFGDCEEEGGVDYNQEPEEDDLHVFPVMELFDKENIDSLVSDTARSCTSLWFALRTIEDAISLRYKFADSKIQEGYLKELKVDPKLVGRGVLPPLRADSVLKPTPLGEDNTRRGGRPVTVSSTSSGMEKVSSGKVSKSSEHIGSTSPSSSQENKKPWLRRSFRFWKSNDKASGSMQVQTRSRSMSPPQSSASTSSKSRPPQIDSLSVPPAEFDWNDSGLVNPLKGQGSSQSSALIDVDFFGANGNAPAASVSSATTLQSDLDALGLSATGASMTLPTISSQQGNALDALLSSQQSTKKYKPVCELSLDARALHDQLPDIDYLKAKMIMFPIGGRGSKS